MGAKKFILMMILFAVITGGVQFAIQNVVPTKWEYRTHYLDPRDNGLYFGADLQEIGDSGWELIAVIPKGKQQLCILKRPALRKSENEDE